MAIHFKQYAPLDLVTGDHVNLEGERWDCVSPCTIVGVTVLTHTPVLRGPDGPRLNLDGELVPDGTLRTTGKPGMVPIEVMTLGQFSQISPTDLKGREIAAIDFNPWQLIITTIDRDYVKLVPVTECGEIRMDAEDITMRDLQTLGYLAEDDWATYEEQLKDARKTDAERHGERQLDQAIRALGANRVLDIAKGVVAVNLDNSKSVDEK